MLDVSMNKEEAMIYAKALAAGRKNEAINNVLEMRWLPLEKFKGFIPLEKFKGFIPLEKFKGFNGGENSHKAAKEFVESGFVLPYETKE
jgi:hypothetical protein